MTITDLKKYALCGILVRLSAEQKSLKKTNDEIQKKIIQQNIDELTEHYNLILTSLSKKENPQ